VNEIQELQELLRELLAGIQEVLQSGEILTDEFQGQLAETLNILTTRIDELQNENPTEVLQPAQAEQPPNIGSGPFESSNINGFKYNPKTKDLYVQFHGPYPQAAGSVYKYNNVPEFIYNVFSQGAVGPKTSGQNRYHKWIKGVTPSLGGTMNALIKAGGFQYQRLS